MPGQGVTTVTVVPQAWAPVLLEYTMEFLTPVSVYGLFFFAVVNRFPRPKNWYASRVEVPVKVKVAETEPPLPTWSGKSALASTAFAPLAQAQTWPTRTVHVIVPFTAGSATDILARTFGQKLSEMWAQPVVIENRPGAGGTIGAAVVAKSTPDGYTLLVHSAAQAYNASIYSSLPYDTSRDFVEIAPLAVVGGGFLVEAHIAGPENPVFPTPHGAIR